jgi:GABA(A) receptor-associated protein
MSKYHAYYRSFEFYKTRTHDERTAECKRIREKYPTRVPIVCEKSSATTLESIDKNKFLVPEDLTLGQFSYIIRKRLTIPSEIALFLIVNNTMPTVNTQICDLLEQYGCEDGFLYIKYTGESTFGKCDFV